MEYLLPSWVFVSVYISGICLFHSTAVDDLFPLRQQLLAGLRPAQVHPSSECSGWDLLLPSSAKAGEHTRQLSLWPVTQCKLRNGLEEVLQMLQAR